MEEEEIEGNSVFVAKRWMPYEISLVSSPADPSATFGRSLIEPNTMPSVKKSDIVEDKYYACKLKKKLCLIKKLK